MADGKRNQEEWQVAALPLRAGRDGTPEILFVTSRRTRRWVLPKGNRMKGFADPDAARIEAEEEAGVSGEIARHPYGRYHYWKRRAFSFELCRVDAFLLFVNRQSATFKEMHQRESAWVPLSRAARIVLEPGLQAMLRSLAADEAVLSRLRPPGVKESVLREGAHAA